MAGALQGKVAVVTGASSGLGRATAMLFAAEGAAVVAVARRADRLAGLAAEIGRSNGRCVAVAGDAAEEGTGARAIDAAVSEFGRLDVLVNNAGIGSYKVFAETSADEFDRMMRANVRSGYVFTRMVVPRMVEQRSGCIVFVSSVAGLAGAANEAIYCATKFAQVGMAQALAEELHPFGVKVCALCPGGMKSEFALGAGRTEQSIAASTMMDPEQTAAAILFACTQPANVRVTQMVVRHMGRQN